MKSLHLIFIITTFLGVTRAQADQPIGMFFVATRGESVIYVQGVAHAVKKNQNKTHLTVQAAIQKSDKLLAEVQIGVKPGDAPLSKLLTTNIDYRKNPWVISKKSERLLTELIGKNYLPQNTVASIQTQPPLWLPSNVGRELASRHSRSKALFEKLNSSFELSAKMPSIAYAESIGKQFYSIEINGVAFGFWHLNCNSSSVQEKYIDDIVRSATDLEFLEFTYNFQYDAIYTGNEAKYVDKLNKFIKKYPGYDLDNICHNVDRNREWASYLSNISSREGSKKIFIMVGAGHVIPIKSQGNNTVLLELEKLGFKIRRIKDGDK